MSASRVVSAIAGILTAILIVAPVGLWSAMALWFRLPAPDAVRAVAAGVAALAALATMIALFTRFRWRALGVFALAFAGVARLVEHDHAAARRRLGARRRPADDRDGQGRHSDPLRRPRLRLAHRRRLHRAVGDALLRPLEARFARSHPLLLGRAEDGPSDHELRLRRRAGAGLVDRGPARERRRLFAGRRRLQVAHARLARHDRARLGPPAHERARRGRAALSPARLARRRSARCSSAMSTKPTRSSRQPSGTTRSPPIARPPSRG